MMMTIGVNDDDDDDDFYKDGDDDDACGHLHMLKAVKLILEIDPQLCPVPSQNIIIMNIATIITIIL